MSVIEVSDRKGWPLMVGSTVSVFPPDREYGGVQVHIKRYRGTVRMVDADNVSVWTTGGVRHCRPGWCEVKRMTVATRKRVGFEAEERMHDAWRKSRRTEWE